MNSLLFPRSDYCSDIDIIIYICWFPMYECKTSLTLMASHLLRSRLHVFGCLCAFRRMEKCKIIFTKLNYNQIRDTRLWMLWNHTHNKMSVKKHTVFMLIKKVILEKNVSCQIVLTIREYYGIMKKHNRKWICYGKVIKLAHQGKWQA